MLTKVRLVATLLQYGGLCLSFLIQAVVCGVFAVAVITGLGWLTTRVIVINSSVGILHASALQGVCLVVLAYLFYRFFSGLFRF